MGCWTSNENLIWTELCCGQEIERVAGKLDLQQSGWEKGCFIMKIIFGGPERDRSSALSARLLSHMNYSID